MVQQRRALDTGRYRRRFRLWMLLLVWMMLLTGVGAGLLFHAEERRKQARIDELFTICREDEIIKRIIRDDLNEQIAQEEALLSDPSVLPPFLRETTRLSLARHRRQRDLLASRNCSTYSRDAGLRPVGSG